MSDIEYRDVPKVRMSYRERQLVLSAAHRDWAKLGIDFLPPEYHAAMSRLYAKRAAEA